MKAPNKILGWLATATRQHLMVDRGGDLQPACGCSISASLQAVITKDVEPRGPRPCAKCRNLEAMYPALPRVWDEVVKARNERLRAQPMKITMTHPLIPGKVFVWSDQDPTVLFIGTPGAPRPDVEVEVTHECSDQECKAEPMPEDVIDTIREYLLAVSGIRNTIQVHTCEGHNHPPSPDAN